MSLKDLYKTLYIQNCTTGEVRELPYFKKDCVCYDSLKKEVLYHEITSMLDNTDCIKIFFTF